MGKDGTWGGQVGLETLRRVLKRQFCVFTDSKDVYYIGNQILTQQDHITLAYDRSKLHYSSLRPKSQSDSKEKAEESIQIQLGKEIILHFRIQTKRR